jgi:hypothetical protein
MARSQKSCLRMARDVERIADVTTSMADGAEISGLVLGPASNEIYYRLKCARKGKFGPGDCTVWEIEREGPGVRGLRAKDTVGNMHGLITQLARDLTRLWGCAPGREIGFEGARRRKRKR